MPTSAYDELWQKLVGGIREDEDVDLPLQDVKSVSNLRKALRLRAELHGYTIALEREGDTLHASGYQLDTEESRAEERKAEAKRPRSPTRIQKFRDAQQYLVEEVGKTETHITRQSAMNAIGRACTRTAAYCRTLDRMTED